MISMVLYFIFDPPRILVLSLLLQEALILAASATRTVRQRLMDRIAFIIIEIFKDSWRIYCRQLTQGQLCRNIGSNVKKALLSAEI
ncbi:hypothetical protein CPB86DRAFT_497569 [Serendipita vermifera]|nr:hypothetical protein CPB86DRAFT_497569 [Serendipita vermifera]